MTEIIDIKSRHKRKEEKPQPVVEFLKELMETDDLKNAAGVLIVVGDADGETSVYSSNLSPMEELWYSEQARIEATADEEELEEE